MITKKNSELKKGDVIRCEFGDYGNIVTVEVESVKQEDNYWIKIVGHYVKSKAHVVMYGHVNDTVEILN